MTKRRWRPTTIRLSQEDYAEQILEGRDERAHYLGCLSWWSLPNDKGFAIRRRSFHLLAKGFLDD